MRIAAEYSHKGGKEVIEAEFPGQLQEIKDAVASVDLSQHKTKVSKETGSRLKPGDMLYNPRSMNDELKTRLAETGWQASRIAMQSPTDADHAGFREMDGVKDQLGLEVQFGKYAFVLYDILGKMPIFAKRGLIRAGVELVPMKQLTKGMSSGVSYFEQVTADLHERGAADLDVPTLVLGIGFKTAASGLFVPDPDAGDQDNV